MNADRELLSFIHKNAAMGVAVIPMVLSLPQSRGMTAALEQQLAEYRTTAAQAQQYAQSLGKPLHGPGSPTLLMARAMLQAQTALHPGETDLAELMIRGSTSGTIQMVRRLHALDQQSDPGIADMGRRLLHAEERNIQQLKQYL